jgi:hypothetical protein
VAKTWKASELAIAKLLGGERVPINGRVRGSAPDVAHSWLAIEVKSLKNLPARMVDAMDQAEKSAAWAKRKEGKDKLPIAIIHHDRQNHHNDLVVMRLGQFMEHFGT